jgi:hypothetical protein
MMDPANKNSPIPLKGGKHQYRAKPYLTNDRGNLALKGMYQ